MTTESEQEGSGTIAPESALPPVTLEDLPAPMRDAVARAGWPALMPVPAQAIP